jgi:hypothetical protein
MSGFVTSADNPEAKAFRDASKRPKVATLNYTGEVLTSISFSDGDGYTAHTRTLSYTGTTLTGVTESFVFGGSLWTSDKLLGYSSGKLATVENN